VSENIAQVKQALEKQIQEDGYDRPASYTGVYKENRAKQAPQISKHFSVIYSPPQAPLRARSGKPPNYLLLI
jgi:hypothetical protein